MDLRGGRRVEARGERLKGPQGELSPGPQGERPGPQGGERPEQRSEERPDERPDERPAERSEERRQERREDKRDRIVLMLAGDVMTGRGIDQILAHPGAPGLLESHVADAREYVRLAEARHGPVPLPVPADYIWGEALPEIERAAPDLRLVNLETAVTAGGEAWPAKGIHYRMNPANLDCLKAARIDCCALANNHVLDWGRSGLEDTLRSLREAGLRTAGAGVDGEEAWAPARLAIPGRPPERPGQLLVFGFGCASSGIPRAWSAGPRRPGVALLPDLSDETARVLAEDVARRRSEGDLVVVSIHWGGNWGLEVPAAHRAFARRLIELRAADLIHGHSSHHPMAAEVYRGKLILYGCGDLVNDYEGIGPDAAHGRLRGDLGCLYFATLAAPGGQLLRLEIVPLQRQRLRLVAADPAGRAWLAPIFSVGACRLEPPRALRQLPAWVMRWQPATAASTAG